MSLPMVFLNSNIYVPPAILVKNTGDCASFVKTTTFYGSVVIWFTVTMDALFT